MIHTLYDLNHDLNGAILSPATCSSRLITVPLIWLTEPTTKERSQADTGPVGVDEDPRARIQTPPTCSTVRSSAYHVSALRIGFAAR